MEKELYFCVDASKNTSDVAYYNGEKINWKDGHLRVNNNETGFKKIGEWIEYLGITRSQCIFCMEHTGLYDQNFRLWLEKENIIYGMVNGRKMHHFEPDLDYGERALDRIKSDEMDSYRIAIYCELNKRKIKRSPSHLPSEAFFKLKRLQAERRQYVKQAALYKQPSKDTSIYDSVSALKRKKDELNNAIKNTDKEIGK